MHPEVPQCTQKYVKVRKSVSKVGFWTFLQLTGKIQVYNKTRPRTPWHVGQQTSDGRNVNIKLEFCEAEFPIMS